MDLLILGAGFSGRAVAHRLHGRGWRITGTSTTAAGVARLNDRGIGGLVFDGTGPSPALSQRLRTATHLLLSIAPGTDGDPVLRHYGADISAHAPGLGWIGYLSTVGVYGDWQGAWVDEASELRPMSTRGRARVAAERGWLDLTAASDPSVTVFRLSGIYGPGRSAVDGLDAGTARRIIKPGQIFNRIHVDDIAGAVIASIDHVTSSAGGRAVYNVTDHEPAPPQDVVAYAATCMVRPVPPDIPFADAQLSEMGRSFYAETKRVSNARLIADLGYRFRFPTYRDGIADIARRAGYAVG